MATAATQHLKPAPAYPAKAVEETLRDELIKSVRAEASRRGAALPTSDDDLVVASIEIDSLIAVEALCMLDELLPFEVGEEVVRAGGYQSVSEAIEHVVGRVEEEWAKHQSGGKP